MRNYEETSKKGKFISIRAIHQDDKRQEIEPYFEESENIGDEWKVIKTEKPLKSFGGRLFKIAQETKEFTNKAGKKEKQDFVKLYFRSEDEQETYAISLGFRVATRNLFNNLLGLDKFDNLSIHYGHNKNKFETFWLHQNGEWFKDGLLTYDELEEKVTKTKLEDGEVIRGYKALNTLLKEKLEELSEELNKKSPAPAKTEKVVEQNGDDSEEIPF